MEGSTRSEGIDKPWDYAWSTEEMRNHRRDWSLAGDSGLLKHLQQFSENLTKKANETQDAINVMTSQLNETAILVDNITNTSLALANTQFIESRVQEDNIEIEQSAEIFTQNEVELNPTDLLVSICESVRQGLSIMDEKYEKVEVAASDSEDEDENAEPSVILRPKDPYQDRPLPYVFGTEQWKSSSKVGLESSSSESESDQNDEEDSVSDTDGKNVENILNSNTRTNLGIGRLSSTSSESNDYNVESNSIKNTDSRLQARSHDTFNSDTEPTTPSSILPKTQNINSGTPSFAEELAKRLGSVLPSQKNVFIKDSNEQTVNCSKDNSTSVDHEQDVFIKKSDDLFNEGKNLFSDEVPSSSWKSKPLKPVNKNIIPPSIDVPPPLSIIASTPKSTLDDLFGDADDSEDSDDVFSKKTSKDIFATEREAIRSEVVSKQKSVNIQNAQNTSNVTTNTSEINDKRAGLFDDEDDDDLFGSVAKQVKSSNEPSTESTKKKPIGDVSVFGKVDIFSSSKFPRRPSSSSASSTDSADRRIGSNVSESTTGLSAGRAANSKSSESSVGTNAFSSLEAGNNVGNFATMSGSSSGISVRQPSIDNTAGSSLGADFQPVMNSTRLKSEEIYRERVASDSLFTVGASQSRNSNSNDRQQQQQQQHQQQQQQAEDASEHEDVFGPPPLPKASESSKTKSKINILFGDTDSDDDLFTSASPSSKSIKSSEHTPSKTQTQKKKSLFDDDDDLFGSKDAPDVDLFAAAPVKTLLPKIAGGLFDELDDSVTDGNLFGEKPKSSEKSRNSGTVNSLFGEVATGVSKVSKDSVENLFGDSSGKVFGSKIVGDNLFGEISKSEESTSLDNKSAKKTAKAEKVSEKKIPKGLFDDTEDSLDSDLFAPISKPSSKASSIVPEKSNALSSSKKSIFEDTPDSDLFGSSSSNVLEKNVIEKSSGSLFNNTKETSDIFETKTTKAVSEKDLFEDKSEVSKPKKKTTSIFDDSDEDDDLFGGSSFSKKINTKSSSIFEEDKIISVSKKMDEENKMDTKKVSIQTKDEKVKEESKSSKVTKKVIEKNSLFEDDDDDDDDDDLFGEKNKVIKKKGTIEKESFESKANTEIFTKSEAAPKKAFLAEIKQKLEKHNVEKSEISEPSVVDGAVSSKKEPPKSLKIQTTLPMPDESLSNNQQAPKKPVVSGKIKNLMGKMGDLKILSPTDTPPLWRKNTEEKSEKDDEQESIGDLESSGASTPSLVSGGSSPQTSGTNSRARDSPSLKSDNTEVAISFDEPAQVETLTSIASKNRVRIPTKRRPQSRHARQSALRHSGIDFDIVDASAVSPVNDQPNSDVGDAQAISDRLLPSRASHSDGSKHNALDSGHMDDRSEINSVSRNTTTNLLSPSTDEEDLFDVPPDLPEDPSAKEDSLFGRAPILSPVEPIQKPKKEVQPTKKETATNKAKENFTDEEREERSDKKKKETTASLDPLRDDSHDPIKDPSQLFAFVTKTPSPEKNKALLLNEDDDSLFSSSSKPIETKSKPTLDLFVDDDDTSSSDLFSSSKTRIKKPLKDTKIDLFGEASPEFDDDDSLFGSTTKKNEKTKNKESSPASSAAVKVDDKIDSKNIKTAVKDNFEESSDTDDIFASGKKVIPQKKTKSLFDDDEYDADDDDDIFAKPKSSVVRDSKVMADNGRPVVKKAITRDLTKTAEKIVEDPLSMLQDD